MSSAKDRRRARREEKRRQERDQLSQKKVESPSDSASSFRMGVITSLVLVAAVISAPPEVQHVAIEMCAQPVEIVNAKATFSWSAPQIRISPETLALARVAALENVLLRDLEASYFVPKGHRLYDLEQRLCAMIYCADVETALGAFILGRPYMMAMSEDLATEPLVDPFGDALPLPGSFVFYEDIDGELIPTPEAIEAWTTVRYRLARKTSMLGKMLRFSMGEAPDAPRPRVKHVA
jgi:hypothetical protein